MRRCFPDTDTGTSPQQPDDFTSFTFRIGSARFQFFDELKMSSKEQVELFAGHLKWRTALLRHFAGIPGVQEENCQQSTLGLQGAGNCPDVIHASCGLQRAKAGVLKNPVKAVCQSNGKIKKIRPLIGFISGKRESPSPTERTRGNVQTDDLCIRGGSGNGSDIMSRAATRHQDIAADRTPTLKPLQKGRRRRPLFPRGIAGFVSLFPIQMI